MTGGFSKCTAASEEGAGWKMEWNVLSCSGTNWHQLVSSCSYHLAEFWRRTWFLPTTLTIVFYIMSVEPHSPSVFRALR